MTRNFKITLIIYALTSAISFSYLIMPQNAGISVLIFSLIQFVFLFFTVPDKKRLLFFIPIFIISANSFWSANTIWRFSNFFVNILLYVSMFTKFDIKDTSFEVFNRIFYRLFEPFSYFNLPVKWSFELTNKKTATFKRILIALTLAIPSTLFITLILASADMVFSLKVSDIINLILKSIHFHNIPIIIWGILAGMYLFGNLYSAHSKSSYQSPIKNNKEGDLIIINILLCSLLFVYTFFVIIQFKYLFAGSVLPDGLSYTEYARKGFFELLILTGINIAIILTVVHLTNSLNGKWLLFTKVLCCYLCVITIILLISSFYRMYLYTNDDGLTRLRLLVMIFLIFEGIGLLITLYYIIKPRFNICIIYLLITLCYYTFLNILPTDNIIAKNQINKYLRNERTGLEYIFTLSMDTSLSMEFLYNNTTDESIKENVKSFLENHKNNYSSNRWQKYNLSHKNTIKILNKLK